MVARAVALVPPVELSTGESPLLIIVILSDPGSQSVQNASCTQHYNTNKTARR